MRVSDKHLTPVERQAVQPLLFGNSLLDVLVLCFFIRGCQTSSGKKTFSIGNSKPLIVSSDPRN